MWFSVLTALGFLTFLIWYLASSDLRTRRWTGLACTLCIGANCLHSLLPIDQQVKLGLDLKGGTSFLLQLEGEPTPSALEQATEVIRKRIDSFGLTEPLIQPTGTNRITVQIPGLAESNKAAAREQLSKVAKLEFRLVHPESAQLLAAVRAGTERLPLDYVILPFVAEGSTADSPRREIIVKRRPEMSGKYVNRAYRGFDELGRPTVVLEFTGEGGKLFGDLTAANVNKQMAIVLDREVHSAPNINQAIYGGTATISGGKMTAKEAEDLASVLENPLETPVRILEERGVDPSLGRDSIESGRNAGILALVLVIGFMLVCYRLAGFVAVIALSVNLLILIGALAQFGFTLTLPGIAGIILTIGMAVDANVLIYERIRDELKSGKPFPNAVEGGFSRAFSAIFDSNITTIIPAVILIFLGSGPLQGFAVTLTIGIVANLFTAVVVSRNVFEWLLSTNRFTTLHMVQFVREPKVDFLGWRFRATALSALLILGGIVLFSTRLESLLGVDFAGGDSVTLTYTHQVPVSEVRKTLESSPYRVSSIQYASAEGKLLLQTRLNEGEAAGNLLKSTYPDAGFQLGSLDSVGPVVGQELTQRAAWSLLLGLLGILIYVAIRYEWSFAIAAGLAQVHDVLIAAAVLAALGGEFNMTLVGAFLTVLGYSINDKIVIFDRMREAIHIGERPTLLETMNLSLNLTLARTIMTGGTVLLAVLALLLFGGVVIHNFALAMLAGVLAGIYSSHFIAPSLALWLSQWRKNFKLPLFPEITPNAPASHNDSGTPSPRSH